LISTDISQGAAN